MGKRREGREAAVQFLYQVDLHSGESPLDTDAFWALRSGPEPKPPVARTRIFTEQLIAGVTAHLSEVDELITKYAANYQLGRIAAVDRNILRVAIYEMLFSPDVAPVIVINEAIEIAKKFGTEKSGGFVNGILDRIRKDLGSAGRVPASPSSTA
jgi:N utilization substance protein B